MKKLLLIAGMLTSALFATQSILTKTGFLTTQSCAKAGTFVDCNLQDYKRNDLVLFVHDEGKYYKVKTENPTIIARLDQAFSHNEIKLYSPQGIVNDTLYVDKVEMKEIKKGELFKGCL